MITVMVTGVDGGAAQSIMKCLRLAKGYRIIAVGVDPLCIGIYRGDVGYLVSKDWERYKEEIKEISEKEGVEIIIPGSDIELDHFCRERKWYEKECPPILIDWENVNLARDKYLLQKRLKEMGFPYIKTWLEKDFDKVDRCPLVLKPRRGFGSRLLFKDVRKKWLKPLGEYIRSHGWEPIAQEQVEGHEFSCMTLRAKDGELLSTFLAWSVKKFGQSFKTCVMKDGKEMEELIVSLGERIKSIGPLSFQLIKDAESGELKVFELNARFTGAQIVRAYGGVNMVDLAVRNWLFGEKDFLKVRGPFIAYWYHSFGYGSMDEFVELLKKRRVEGRKLKLPKFL